MDDSKPYPQPSPWQPEQDKLRLALLGKLAEELNEAGAIVARCIIQGIDESEPMTRRLNKWALENELADVQATTNLVVQHFFLDRERMATRVARKIQHLTGWHKLLKKR